MVSYSENGSIIIRPREIPSMSIKMLDISAWAKECMMHSKRAQLYLVSVIYQLFCHEIQICIESRGNGASLMKIGTKRRRTKVQMELDAQ